MSVKKEAKKQEYRVFEQIESLKRMLTLFKQNETVRPLPPREVHNNMPPPPQKSYSPSKQLQTQEKILLT